MFDLIDVVSATDEGIPSGLGSMEPGPVLAAFLATIDVRRVSGHDKIVVLRAHARMAAHYQAQIYDDMAAVTECMRQLDEHRDSPTGAAAAEIRAALHLTRRATENELTMALDLRERLPAVWAALANGDIDRRRAGAIAHGTAHLPMATAHTVADAVLEDAKTMTTGQIAARLRKLCLEAEPEEAQRRYEEAVADRCVTIEENPSGTGNLYACDLPADRLASIRRRIHEVAQRLKTGEETRTMDQLRTDVLLDLLEGREQEGPSRRCVVDIQVDLATLAELRDTPGELAGFGPVVADVARQVADRQRDHEWRWTLTDPATGGVIDNGITSRRPTAAQRRHVEARRPTCVFPGCRMPAVDSDLDHRMPFSEGGRTKTTHLAPLCRHDHCIRHRYGWTYRPLPDGRIEWRSRLGHIYVTGRAPP